MLTSCCYGSQLNGKETVRFCVVVVLIGQYTRLLLEFLSDVLIWGNTGGRVYRGATPLKCGCREVMEETGICLTDNDLHFFNIYGDPNDGRILTSPDNRIYLTDILFFAFINSTSGLIISDESIFLQFFNIASMPNVIVLPAIKPLKVLTLRGLVR